MTSQQKAKELIDKFYQSQIESLNKIGLTEFIEVELEIAVKSSLITVEEILNISYFNHEPTEDDLLYKNYWQEVKNELLKRKNNG